MPNIASINAGEPATLSDLCDLIEQGTEHERLRFYTLVRGSSFEAMVGTDSDAWDPPMAMLGQAARITCKRCHEEMRRPHEAHECKA